MYLTTLYEYKGHGKTGCVRSCV